MGVAAGRPGRRGPSASDPAEADVDRFVDGNALTGPPAEVFAVDLTAARARCGSCGEAGPPAAPRVNRSPGAAWSDLRGAASLRTDLADQPVEGDRRRRRVTAPGRRSPDRATASGSTGRGRRCPPR
ncbi:DUF6510 family protein [Saccharothrix yanglingensis]|uniref:DUF6510 family protein n=1 Tax=Saccharothrix yanglingensis TaxID=659496 RepID=UPI0027D2CD7C|nr:DUF6510 family protein [Saccharothrix yanglingensis]